MEKIYMLILVILVVLSFVVGVIRSNYIDRNSFFKKEDISPGHQNYTGYIFGSDTDIGYQVLSNTVGHSNTYIALSDSYCPYKQAKSFKR